MLITADTKIGAIINSNPAAIDVLVAVNKHFVKLRNPVLRRVLAPRVTVAEAARIGNCGVDLILESLSGIGFETGKAITVRNKAIASPSPVDVPVYDCILDVRPQLSGGVDPFGQIIKKLAGMNRGQTLLLINSFEPSPLIRILKGQGYAITVSPLTETLVHTYISKGMNEIVKAAKGDPGTEDSDCFDALLSKYKDNLVEIDVRDLEMPQPMITILDNLDRLPPGKALCVHHKKIPVYLLPELKEKGFQYTLKHVGSEVKMIIYHQTDL